MIRVLLISTEYPPYIFGGGGTFIYNLAMGLKKHNIEVFVLSKNYTNNTYSVTYEDNIRIYYVPSPNIQPRHVWFQLYSKRFLIELIRKIEPDIIHANSFSGGIFFKTLSSSNFNIPKIITLHDYPYIRLYLSIKSLRKYMNLGQLSTYFLGYPLWELILQTELKVSNKIVAVSKFLKEIVQLNFKNMKHKVIYIPNGIDIEHITDTAKKHESKVQIDKNRFIIASGGRLYYEKGHLFLIYAFKKLIKQGTKDVVLYIFGDGPLKRTLERKIKDLGIEKYVKLLGKVSYSDVLYIIGHADVFVVPSIYELLPIIILEALALKKPIVTLKTNYVDEFLNNGIYLEVADSMADLARRIVLLLEKIDDNELKEKIERNFSILRQQYSIDVMVRNYIELYKSLIR